VSAQCPTCLHTHTMPGGFCLAPACKCDGANESQVIVYFNPFAFAIEQNNEFVRLGYEPMVSSWSE
jgi:hypothetical protein